jgi:uncharacterized glyoxalase superfamily protein PhnB
MPGEDTKPATRPARRPPPVACDQLHAELAVSDLGAALEFYTAKLGFDVAFTWGEPPTMAGVNLGEMQIFLSQGTPNPKGHAVYFVVDDVNGLYDFHVESGVEVVEPVGDREYEMRDYMVRDLYGHLLSFGQHRFDVGPPVVIERVDVPVRLEKRLAALLQDLADHKRMSLSACLEEILLHTNEPFGDGVASPHTKSQLALIQELKKRHGIDYDCHASYRFVERGRE